MDKPVIFLDPIDVRILKKCYPEKTLETAVGLIIREKCFRHTFHESNDEQVP
jgi:hypothetical protein